MKITFFERKFNANVISIEKLFDIIKGNLINRSIEIDVIKNPYNIRAMWKSLWFFKRKQGEINHITGDIHWASLLLDSDRLVLTIHDLVGLEDLKGVKKFLYYYIWFYFPIRKAKYITVISEKIKNDIIRLMPFASSKITVIPNCVTIPIKVPREKDKVNKVLIVGTRSNKNVERIIKALEGIPVHVYIVGKLSESQSDLIKKININFNNYINISDSDLERLYDDSDILCFVSLYEGFGLPILEAQARSCIVITSNISPMIEIAGGGAIFVDPTNVDEIREALIVLINDKEKRNQLINLGYNNVLNYLPSVITDQYLKIYKLISKTYKKSNF